MSFLSSSTQLFRAFFHVLPFCCSFLTWKKKIYGLVLGVLGVVKVLCTHHVRSEVSGPTLVYRQVVSPRQETLKKLCSCVSLLPDV